MEMRLVDDDDDDTSNRHCGRKSNYVSFIITITQNKMIDRGRPREGECAIFLLSCRNVARMAHDREHTLMHLALCAIRFMSLQSLIHTHKRTRNEENR